jgi:hypothetical protein
MVRTGRSCAKWYMRLFGGSSNTTNTYAVTQVVRALRRDTRGLLCVAHAGQDRRLTQHIIAVVRRHRGRYGSPRIYRELKADGWRVSRRRVEQLHFVHRNRVFVCPHMIVLVRVRS